jgi:hypothetical protein
MYFLYKDGMWLPVTLGSGDRLVIDGRNHLFWGVKRLPGPKRIRADSLRDVAMGFLQPNWKRLWMCTSDGDYKHQLKLPASVEDVFDGADPLAFLVKEFGQAVLGEGNLRFEEDSDIGRKVLKQRSFCAFTRVTP